MIYPMSAPRNIEGLLFDLGGVVIEIDFERALQSWNQWTLLSIEEMRDRFKMDEAYERHERGEVEASEYFTHLRNVLELEASDSEIVLGWNAIFLNEIVESVNYIRAVNSDLPCFAFTNSNPTHQISWMSVFPRVVESFHQIFVSSELGLRKPEREAFEAIADATGIGLDAMLFFDDTEENVKGAQAAGMQAVHVKGHMDVKQALSKIGVL
jgi:FMN phosphatase YigB (HAD superfamily)